jgi:hypothetical protein
MAFSGRSKKNAVGISPRGVMHALTISWRFQAGQRTCGERDSDSTTQKRQRPRTWHNTKRDHNEAKKGRIKMTKIKANTCCAKCAPEWRISETLSGRQNKQAGWEKGDS